MSTDIDQIQAKHPNIRSQDAEDLKIINASLNNLFTRSTFVSHDPYVLTIPQDREFAYKHRNNYQASQFAHSTPFNHQEREGLQYQTFRYYEPGTTLYKQFPSTDDDLSERSPQKKTPATAPKKVMSLSTYKKQKLGSSPLPRDQNLSKTDSKEQDKTKAESADILAGLDVEMETEYAGSKDDHTTIAVEKSTSQDTKALKRRRDDEAEQTSQAAREPSPKRSRVFETERPHDGQVRKMPYKLSPLHDPEMPHRLSPTLPEIVETALRERKDKSRRDHHTNGKVTPKKTEGKQTKSSKEVATQLSGDDDSTVVKREQKPVAKRQKHSEDPDGAKSPVSPSTKAASSLPSTKKEEKSDQRPHTPVSNTGDAHKNLLSTPGSKRSLTNGVTRTPSLEPNTPVGDKQRAAKTAVQKAWESEQKRFDQRGRELKHAASASARATPAEPKLAAVHALESFMCYLLAFTCADQAAHAAVPKHSPAIKPWRSLGPFSTFVSAHCKSFPQLVGIAGMLGQAFTLHILELLEVSTDLPSQRTIVEVTAMLRQAALQTKTNLGNLRVDFPESWRVAVKHGIIKDNLSVGELLQGDYQLPIDVLTTPVQAVRASLAMLEEWMAKNNVDVKIKLEPAD